MYALSVILTDMEALVSYVIVMHVIKSEEISAFQGKGVLDTPK